MILDEPTAPVLTPPDPGSSLVVVPAPEIGVGAWAGSPSAVRVGADIYLAYRMRTASSRGYAVQVAKSCDGVSFEPLFTVGKDEVDCESLERPALALTPEGRWRLYLSCATTGTKHWRVELLEADFPASFDAATSKVVLPGDDANGVKDPVIVQRDGLWHLWASVHPLTEPDHTDRMTTEYATSTDGLAWTWHGTALAPRPGEWDARGVRVAAVRFSPDGVAAYYDGRATVEQNCEECTGVAIGPGPAALVAAGTGPVGESPVIDAEVAAGAGLRYITVVDLDGGQERLYYELTNANGSHDLVTELRVATAVI
ncbi:MAG TPA: hypothetical protein VF979_07420 [Streptosporangiaceae bacterium]